MLSTNRLGRMFLSGALAIAPLAAAALHAAEPAAPPAAKPADAPMQTQPPKAEGGELKGGLEAGKAVAEVNGFPIVEHQLHDLTEVMCQQAGCPDDEAKKHVRARLLQHLIDMALLDQAASQRKLSATPEEVQAMYDEMKAQVGGDAKLQEMITKSNRTENEFREEIRDGLARKKLVEAVAAEKKVPPEEMETFMREFVAALRQPSKIIYYGNDKPADAPAAAPPAPAAAPAPASAPPAQKPSSSTTSK